jgi:hypothetical protein
MPAVVERHGLCRVCGSTEPFRDGLVVRTRNEGGRFFELWVCGLCAVDLSRGSERALKVNGEVRTLRLELDGGRHGVRGDSKRWGVLE